MTPTHHHDPAEHRRHGGPRQPSRSTPDTRTTPATRRGTMTTVGGAARLIRSTWTTPVITRWASVNAMAASATLALPHRMRHR